ncbi:MAG TPA: glutamate-1-semialdehyde 2,1-aminomutase [Polyangiaceae bacterium]|nr:glutamate-1-semialdehyde 2,1-aminomutase [Polyangiaceae bacterium]
MRFDKSKELQRKTHRLIPGGAHTYAKGDDQYPLEAPGFIVRGKGCHVWDVDGNEFIEYGMGLRAVSLGHAHETVNAAACRQMGYGHNFVRPSPIELECAEELSNMITGAEMVKFGKNGSDATNAAVKLARAYTGRDLIAVCADHAFFSVDDWFIGSTAMNAGIPRAIRDLRVTFRYNDLASVQTLFDRFPNQIACVMLEPEKETPPADNFLQALKDLCHTHGAVFILDEMITGFRWHNGGGQAYHNVVPDLSAFGKAMGNGFSIAALAGQRDIMRLGGLDHDRERVFLLSLTHGAEAPNLAAALEVMRIYKREPVVATMWRQGERLRAGVTNAVKAHGLEKRFLLLGKPCCLVFGTRDGEGKPSQAFRALFLQELIKRGILAPSFIISYAHTDADVDRTIAAVDESLGVYRRALDEGVERYLVGPPVKPVFRRFN